MWFSLFWPKLLTQFGLDWKVWAAQMKQHFVANKILWKAKPTSQQIISFGKASYRFWVRGVSCQQKQYDIHLCMWTCQVVSKQTLVNGEMQRSDFYTIKPNSQKRTLKHIHTYTYVFHKDKGTRTGGKEIWGASWGREIYNGVIWRWRCDHAVLRLLFLEHPKLYVRCFVSQATQLNSTTALSLPLLRLKQEKI